jgi:hypothetical protein
VSEEQGERAPSAESADKRRRYIRVPSVVPVDFQFVSAQQGPLDAEVRTGITRDLSEHGLCLRIAQLPKALLDSVQAGEKQDVGIVLDIPIPRRTLRVSGRIVWTDTTVEPGQVVLGVEFRDIAGTDGLLIASFAKQAARRPKVIRATIGGLALAVVVVGLAFGWNVMMHRRAMTVAAQQIAQATKQYGDVATDLEKQTQDLLALSQRVRTFAEGEKAEDDSGDADGAPALPRSSSAVEELRISISELQATIAKLKGNVDGIAQAAGDARAKRRPKKAKAHK